METIIIFINHFFDILWWSLPRTPTYVDIIIISAISALIFLVIFKKTSNQEMIRQYKNKIFAHILEIRLYKDQPILTIKIIFSILRYNLIYLRYTLVPLLVMFPIIVVISVQLNNRYGYAPLASNLRFIIRAELDKAVVADVSRGLERIRLETSDGIIVETSPMRIISQASIFWRAKVIGSKGNQQFCRIRIDGNRDTLEKKIFTNRTNHRFSPERTKWRLNSLFISNAEDFIPKSSPFKAISISYNRATYSFLKWGMDPIIIYFILTLILGFAIKPFVGVDI
ncbi:hypothetical protein ACFL0M_01220 [Thermodesulfobacteriota bacterium]